MRQRSASDLSGLSAMQGVRGSPYPRPPVAGGRGSLVQGTGRPYCRRSIKPA